MYKFLSYVIIKYSYVYISTLLFLAKIFLLFHRLHHAGWSLKHTKIIVLEDFLASVHMSLLGLWC